MNKKVIKPCIQIYYTYIYIYVLYSMPKGAHRWEDNDGQ